MSRTSSRDFIGVSEKIYLRQCYLLRSISKAAFYVNQSIRKGRFNAELALRLGKYFCQEPPYRVNRQSRCDMDIAKDKLSGRIAREVHPAVSRSITLSVWCRAKLPAKIALDLELELLNR